MRDLHRKALQRLRLLSASKSVNEFMWLALSPGPLDPRTFLGRVDFQIYLEVVDGTLNLEPAHASCREFDCDQISFRGSIITRFAALSLHVLGT